MVVPAGDRLLPGPFIALLRASITETEDDGQCQAGDGIRGLAERLGVTERSVRRWLLLAADPGSSGLPDVELVDRCALLLDTSVAELYGSMYGVACIPDTEARRRKRVGRPPICLCSRCGEMMLTVAEMCGFCVEESAL